MFTLDLKVLKEFLTSPRLIFVAIVVLIVRHYLKFADGELDI
jgi:hypothetical protein